MAFNCVLFDASLVLLPKPRPPWACCCGAQISQAFKPEKDDVEYAQGRYMLQMLGLQVRCRAAAVCRLKVVLSVGLLSIRLTSTAQRRSLGGSCLRDYVLGQAPLVLSAAQHVLAAGQGCQLGWACAYCS